VRFAVDLFDPGESNIAPGSVADLVALGRAPGSSGAPATAVPTPGASDEPGASGAAGGTGGTGGGAGTGAPTTPSTARDELWVLVVLVVIGFLLVEWLVYHRDAVTRLWRGLRSGGGTTPVTPNPPPAARR
jgi:hypothetical protein